MQVVIHLFFKQLLSCVILAVVLNAPSAFAKKDLFANDPAEKSNFHNEQLVSTSSAQHIEHENTSMRNEVSSSNANLPTDTTESASPKKPSYIESQFTRFKGHLIDAKEDIFGSKKSTTKKAEASPSEQNTLANTQTSSNTETQPDLPTISTTEAAQRAQAFAEGQVINVRKYQEDNQPRYAVKLLQKNGRMKTIKLDGISGAQIEETP